MAMWKKNLLPRLYARLATCGFGAICLSSAALQAEERSLREGCRREIAGLFVSLNDQAIQSEQYLSVLDSSQRKLVAARDATVKEYEAARNAANKGDYDVALGAKRDELASRRANLEAQLEEHRIVSQSAKLRASDLTQKRDKMKVQIEKQVFVFNGPRLNYRKDCPKMRFLCPLPEAHGEALKKLAKDLALPANSPCHRYGEMK